MWPNSGPSRMGSMIARMSYLILSRKLSLPLISTVITRKYIWHIWTIWLSLTSDALHDAAYTLILSLLDYCNAEYIHEPVWIISSSDDDKHCISCDLWTFKIWSNRWFCERWTAQAASHTTGPKVLIGLVVWCWTLEPDNLVSIPIRSAGFNQTKSVGKLFTQWPAGWTKWMNWRNEWMNFTIYIPPVKPKSQSSGVFSGSRLCFVCSALTIK